MFNANDGDKDKFLKCALSNFHAFPVTRFIEAKVNKTKIENTVQMHRTLEAAPMQCNAYGKSAVIIIIKNSKDRYSHDLARDFDK